MKKTMLSIAIAFLSISAFPKPQMIKMSNAHGKTTFWISVPDEDRGDARSLRLENFVLHNNGESCEAKRVSAKSLGNKTNVKVSFKYFKVFEDCRLSFLINGKNQGFDMTQMAEVKWYSE